MVLSLNKNCGKLHLIRQSLFPIIFSVLALFFIRLSAEVKPVNFQDYSEIGSTSQKYGDFRFKINWNPKMGFMMMLTDQAKKTQCVILLRNNIDGVWIQGAKTAANSNLVVKSVNPLPRTSVKDIECVIKLQKHVWKIYLGEKEIIRFKSPFEADSLWFKNGDIGRYKKKIRFQKTAPLYFHDDFLIAREDDNQLDSWEMLSGEWHIHTALDAAIEQKTSRKLGSRPLEAIRSANFYSLKGKGENALIVSGYPFHDNYVVQAAVQVQKGESGLAFYIQDEDNFYSFSTYLSDTDEAFALLKKHTPEKKQRILKAIKLQLLEGQWIMPRIKVKDDLIEAFIDNIKVMELVEQLPPGGQFGLYVNSKNEMVFDDVVAESSPDLTLNSLQDIKFHTLKRNGNVFYKPRFLEWLIGKGEEKEMFPGKSEKKRWVIIGSPEDKIAVFEASFKPKTKEINAGLLLGWQDKENTFYRFILVQTGPKSIIKFEQVEGSKITLLELYDISPLKPGESIDLKAQLSPDGLIKLFYNKQLTIVYKLQKSLQGAAGIFVGQNTEVNLGSVSYRFNPDIVFKDQQEKNEIFSKDPFMRHWASPEGAWLKDPDSERMWHKGDFFGAFSLSVPVIDKSEIHLGVRKNQPSGSIILRMNGENFEILEGEEEKCLLKKSKKELFQAPPVGAKYTLKVKDSWVWGEYNNKIIFKLKMNTPLAGSKVYVTGFPAAKIGELLAFRENVRDFLFTQAPYEWVRNGGTWQVINRFHCDPRWSHMNGQSAEDLASLWSKYQFEGDFCLEMYAGTRHTGHTIDKFWYQRVGDLNLTVMNQGNTTDDGYTFICSGWDPNHSQKNSRILKNGNVIANSDKYLTPRLRDGNVRLHRNPLINTGRDVHGAWYYIKIRRIGEDIEYYFDNEKIFSVKDKDPIKKGGLGVWTFMSSMMVARVKMASEKITQKPFEFQEIPVDQVIKSKTDLAEKPILLLNDLPANLMTSDTWKEFDGAGAVGLTFAQKDDKSIMAVKNILGSGKFAIQGKQLTYPAQSISAWVCDIKRTDGSEFNFHFELGRQISGGKFQTLQRYFYRISGTDYNKGLFQLLGTTGEVKPVKLQNLVTEDGWTRVWFPLPYILPEFGKAPNLTWKIVGFGNFQPSEILQGLKGNKPGDAYAVSNFAPVFYKIPNVRCKTQNTEDSESPIYKLKLDGFNIKTDNLVEFNKRLQDLNMPGLVSGKISIPGKTTETQLMWVMPEKGTQWSCKWDTERPGSIVISNEAKYQYLNNEKLKITVQDVGLPIETLGINKFRASLLDKIDDSFKASLQDEKLNIEVWEGSKKITLELPGKDSPVISQPVLTELEGITPFYQSFESPDLKRRILFNTGRMKYIWDKNRQSNTLQVSNQSTKHRLKTSLMANLSLSKYPIMQYMYKTDPMGQISLTLKYRRAIANLNEPHSSTARKVRYANDFISDGKWHSWTGQVSDAFGSNTYSPDFLKLNTIWFGSIHKEDQTGLNSQLNLDDIVFGPAVNRAEKLAFTPHYYSIDKYIKVQTAISPGVKSYFELNDAEKKEIEWKNIKNNEECIPDLSNTEEGVNQLLLKAMGINNQESTVTSIPFLYDKTPETANFEFKETDDPKYNGSYLQISWRNKNGSPLNHRSIRTSFDGKPVRIDREFSRLKHLRGSEAISINWPYMLRKYTKDMRDGDTKELVVSGIEDGAGNRTEDLLIPVKIDYTKDKSGPTYLKSDFSDKILFHLDAAYFNGPLPFTFKHATSSVKKDSSGSFFRLSSTHDRGYISLNPDAELGSQDLSNGLYAALKIRFPKGTSEETSVRLWVYFNDGRKFPVNLQNGEIREKIITDKLDVNDSDWQYSFVDLKDLIVKRYKREKDLSKIKIRGITLHIKNLQKKKWVDLGFFSICKPFKKTDLIELNGYDQSGIDGIQGKLSDTDGIVIEQAYSEGRAFKLNKLPWLKTMHILTLAMKDRAGNSSKSLTFPLLLKAPPIKVEEEVELDEDLKEEGEPQEKLEEELEENEPEENEAEQKKRVKKKRKRRKKEDRKEPKE